MLIPLASSTSPLTERELKWMSGDPASALEAFGALALDGAPNGKAHYGMARCKQLLGDLRGAREGFIHALGFAQWRAYARLGLGDLLLAEGQASEALASYEALPRALRSTSELSVRIGGCLLALGQWEKAARLLERKLRLDPQNIYLAAHLARAKALTGHFNQAIQLAQDILRRRPDFSEALKAACMAFQGLGDLDQMLRYSKRLLAADPNPIHASHYLYHLLFACSPASEIDAEYLSLRPLYRPGAKEKAAAPVSSSVCAARRLRIGYLTGLLGAHRDCFSPIFRNHDKRQFEVHIFADTRPMARDGAKNFRPDCEHWHEIGSLSNLDAARLIKHMGIDILVDCDGHFESGKRLQIYHHRPAPIQVSFLYPRRVAVAPFDYQITDVKLSPPGESRRSREKLVYLPLFACLEPPVPRIAVGTLPLLANRYVTFGSFNPPLKINDMVVETWSKILHSAPRSKLILHSKMGPLNGPAHPDVRHRLQRLFGRYGISKERIEVHGNRDLASHMRLYNRVDIALDPFPHNGMRTTFMSLWMGVPVLTKAGDSMVSRMGVSLLSEIGLSGWIAPDTGSYVKLATEHASDHAKLAALRAALREKVKQSQLFDGVAFTRNLELAFRQMTLNRGQIRIPPDPR